VKKKAKSLCVFVCGGEERNKKYKLEKLVCEKKEDKKKNQKEEERIVKRNGRIQANRQVHCLPE